MRQEYTHNLINLWWAKQSTCLIAAKQELAASYWGIFFKMVPIKEIDVKSPQLRMKRGKMGNSKSNIFLSNSVASNTEYRSLVQACVWEKENPTLFNDLYGLIYNVGIPYDLRPQVWKDLVQAIFIEFDEITNFKEHYGEYDEKLTVYQNYLQYADSIDCLAYQ
jgi:hypothetical protein